MGQALQCVRKEQYLITDSTDDRVLQAAVLSRNEHCCYVAVVEKLFSDMYTELR